VRTRVFICAQNIIKNFKSVVKKNTKNVAIEVKTAADEMCDQLLAIIADQKSKIAANTAGAQMESTLNALNTTTNALTKRMDEICTKLDAKKTTYADTARNGHQTDPKKSTNRSNDANVVVIKPNDNKTKSSDSLIEVKKILKNANKDPIVRTVRHSGSGGIVLSCSTPQDAKDIIESVGKTQHMTATQPKRRFPKIALYGIASDMTSEELIVEIVKRNNGIKQLIDDKDGTETSQQIKCLFALKAKNTSDTQTWVLEVSPQLYQLIGKNGRIIIDWESHRTADYLRITRCYNCQKYGHIARVCSESEPTCGKCSQNHTKNECQSIEKCCINCKKFNDRLPPTKTKCKTNHSVEGMECESYKAAKSNAISRVDYGL
jgi:hypothetical protein